MTAPQKGPDQHAACGGSRWSVTALVTTHCRLAHCLSVFAKCTMVTGRRDPVAKLMYWKCLAAWEGALLIIQYDGKTWLSNLNQTVPLLL